MKRHLAVVCPGLGAGGAVASVALRQARELARRFEITLLSDDFPEPEMAGFGRKRLKPLRFGSLRRFAHVPNEIAFDLAARTALQKLHRESPIDLVICHGHAVAAIAARPLRRALRIPYALVTHGDIWDRPAGTYDRRLTWLYERVTSPAYRSADLVIAVSPHIAALALKRGAKAATTVVIPNGIDPAEIGLDANGTSAKQLGSRLELLYVGRLSIEKGIAMLIESARLLRLGRTAFRLRIAGTGALFRDVQQKIAELELQEHVMLLGQVRRQDLGELYRSADVLCVPSNSEPFGLVILEAMASGIAVVATEVGGIPSVLVNGVTGLLCPVADAPAFAAALARLSQEPQQVQGMGQAGRERAASKFNWARIGDALSHAIDPLFSAAI
jgi:glycosyltransferase involved in cell wall biosynthesis